MQTMIVGPTPAQPSSQLHRRAFVPSSSQPEPDQTNPDLAASSIENGPQTVERPVYYSVKRLFDLTLVILALGLIWPLIAMIALTITLDSVGAVFVGQKRIGARRQRVNGQTVWAQVIFTVYQFRTTHANGQVTRVGDLLRRTGLYELPQLWNILRGDISLVGPQPALPADVAKYSAWHKRRLETIQGMTGLGQLQDCGKLSFQARVQLDIDYIEHQSVWLDLQILYRTLLVALRVKGTA